MTVVNAVEQIRSSKGGRPTREAAAELGERILDIALEHFLRYGFEGASMDAIAADVQVSKRTLYQRHQSKKGLMLSVRERERHVYRAIVNIPLPRGSVRQQIGMLAHNILDAILNARALGFMKLAQEIRRAEPGLVEDGAFEAMTSYWAGAFRSVLSRDPMLADYEPDRLQSVASVLFDALVTVPFARTTIVGNLEDSKQARSIEIERVLDVLAGGIPSLQRP